MRINMLNCGHRNCGGCLQFIKYANSMIDLGHQVCLVYYGTFSYDLTDVRARKVFSPDLASEEVPDADATICSSWYVAEKLAQLPDTKGEKFYYVQDFENWSGTSEQIIGSWRLPLTKIAVSSYLKEMIALHTGTQAHVNPYGIDFQTFHAAGKLPPDATEIVVGGLYSSVPRKRFQDWISVIQGLCDRGVPVRVTLFGAEPRPELPFAFDYLELPQRDVLRSFYLRCHVWLAMSEQEGLHIPPMEAMACGAVPVTTDIGGMRDYCIDQQSGFRVPVGDSVRAQDRIAELYDDPNLWTRLSLGAQARIRAMGSEQENVRNMIEIFSQHVTDKDGGRTSLFAFSRMNRNAVETLNTYNRFAGSLKGGVNRRFSEDLCRGILGTLDSWNRQEPVVDLISRHGHLYGSALAELADMASGTNANVYERAWALNPDDERSIQKTVSLRGEHLETVHRADGVFDGSVHLFLQPPSGKASGQGGPDAEHWAAFLNQSGRHVLIEGHPFRYPGFSDLINRVRLDVLIRVRTDAADLDMSMLKAFTREVHILLETDGEEEDRVEEWRAVLRRTAMTGKIALSVTCPRDTTLFVPDAGDCERNQNAYCRKRAFLVGPDGNRYPCLSKLLRGVDPMANAEGEALGQDIYVTRCRDYGRCTRYDLQGETSIAVLHEGVPNEVCLP